MYAKFAPTNVECPAGQYADSSLSCQRCPNNYYCDGWNSDHTSHKLTVEDNGKHSCSIEDPITGETITRYSENGSASESDCTVCPTFSNFNTTVNLDDYKVNGRRSVWKDFNGDGEESIDECIMPVFGFGDELKASICMIKAMYSDEEIIDQFGEDTYYAYGLDQPCDTEEADFSLMTCRYDTNSQDYTDCSTMTAMCEGEEFADVAPFIMGTSDASTKEEWDALMNNLIDIELEKKGLTQNTVDWSTYFKTGSTYKNDLTALEHRSDFQEVWSVICAAYHCPDGWVCCGAGTHIDFDAIGTDDQCPNCPAGSYCEGIHWNPETEFDDGATKCLAGTYSSAEGAISADTCQACPENYTTVVDGATVCIEQYAIVYDLDKGTNNENNPSTYTAESQEIILQAPTRDDYNFAGWCVYDSEPNDGANCDINNREMTVTIFTGSTGTVWLYATWTPKPYTITYNTNNGALSGTGITQDENNTSLYTQTYTVLDTITLPNPTKSGYIFGGWCPESVNGDEVSCSVDTVSEIESGTGDRTLYATWFEDKFQIITNAIGHNNETDEDDEFCFDIYAGGNFVIDWDDGGATTYKSYAYADHSDDTQVCHTYTGTPRSRTIRMGGLASQYIDFVYAVNEFPAIAFNTDSASMITEISGSLGHIFPTLHNGVANTDNPRFIGTFVGCENLTALPNDGMLFDGVTKPATDMFRGTFEQTGINNIPEDLFGRVVNNQYIGLTGQVQEDMFEGTFSGCSNLTGTIPEDLFGRVVNGEYVGLTGSAPYAFTNMFMDSGITEIKENLFGRTINGQYYGISGGEGAEGMFIGTFVNTGITEIPDNLFAGIDHTAQFMFQGTFEGNESLTALPASLFPNITGKPAEMMFSYMFASCTNLGTGNKKYVPYTLFANISTENFDSDSMKYVFNETALKTKADIADGNYQCPEGMVEYTGWNNTFQTAWQTSNANDSNAVVCRSLDSMQITCPAGQYAYLDGSDLRCIYCPEGSYCTGENGTGGTVLGYQDNGKYECPSETPNSMFGSKVLANCTYCPSTWHGYYNQDMSSWTHVWRSFIRENLDYDAGGSMLRNGGVVGEWIDFDGDETKNINECFIVSGVIKDQSEGTNCYPVANSNCDWNKIGMGTLICRYDDTTDRYSNCSSVATACNKEDGDLPFDIEYGNPSVFKTTYMDNETLHTDLLNAVYSSDAEWALLDYDLGLRGLTRETVNWNNFFVNDFDTITDVSQVVESTTCCADGYYLDVSGENPTCTICPAGSYCGTADGYPLDAQENMGIHKCINSYSSVEGATSCRSCPTDYITDPEGNATKPTDCYTSCDTDNLGCLPHATSCELVDENQTNKTWGGVCATKITGCDAGYTPTDAAEWFEDNPTAISWASGCPFSRETCKPGDIDWCGASYPGCVAVDGGEGLTIHQDAPALNDRYITSCNAFDNATPANQRNFVPTVSGNQCWMKITKLDNVEITTSGWVYIESYESEEACANHCGIFNMASNPQIVGNLINSVAGNNVCEANTINIDWIGVDDPGEAATCTFGKQLTVPTTEQTPQLDGYSFVGWTTGTVTSNNNSNENNNEENGDNGG